jgi:hypothetical protein
VGLPRRQGRSGGDDHAGTLSGGAAEIFDAAQAEAWEAAAAAGEEIASAWDEFRAGGSAAGSVNCRASPPSGGLA